MNRKWAYKNEKKKEAYFVEQKGFKPDWLARISQNKV